ncbi:Flp pilus assembly complex ATPase component TadA, partial [bacterium]|nr:Flp pilus assembly complex ATPase component TadA [candidate division CSSED10-310 bacterium]
EIAFRAALTGHLVLATLHTNDSISAIERLIDLGLDPPMIALGLSGIIAQSLVRKICKNCREFYSPNVHIQQILGLTSMKNLTFARGKGCEECNGKGTKGRIGIYEVLIISEEIQKHIALNRPYDEIKKAAILEGWHPLRFSAVRKVLRHQTTVEEIIGMLH